MLVRALSIIIFKLDFFISKLIYIFTKKVYMTTKLVDSRFRDAWKLREVDGSKLRAVAYYLPHELMEEFYNYSQWVNSNPLYESVIQQKTGDLIEVPKMRAMSIRGFCLFIGVAQSTFNTYENKDGYKNICKVIHDAIYTQKFEGAAAGLLNSNLIIRDLGLNDTITHQSSEDKKTIDELFPAVEEIDCIVIEETKELPYET